ncbi:hypothetical protein ABIB40_003994 [Pedobacter sp. UYP30]|uniref:hypothetical protein n=1 Tax=Pedobacter sp. UYP30 TaxID=1756400 RepID=UPI0033986E86
MKQKIDCYFCGEPATTKDHIPSKNLLEKPYPKNLLTIDACAKCNHSFSFDEEYFLNVLTTLSESPNLRARTEPGGSIYKSRTRSSKLFERLLKSIKQDDDGRTYLRPETERLKKVIEKNAFGLYYHKYDKIPSLNSFKCVGFYPFNAEETRPEEIILLTHTEKFLPKKWTHIQEDVFSYIVVRDWRRNNQLTMIFHIHNTAWCVIKISFPTSNKWNKRSIEGQYQLFKKNYR